jgi:DNA-binding GntR family transcriptional regulator
MTSSIADNLKVKIENEILMFNFKPGDRLDECRLADRYGSSRTPVREALRLLAADGLVRIRPHRGAVVAGLSIGELMEMFEMMAVYEGVCARLAATHGTDEEIGQIVEAQEACGRASEANDVSGYCLANARFHDAIYRASHNRYLMKRTIATRNRLGAYRRLQSRRGDFLKACYAEHEQVLAAIRAGQADLADCLMRTHIGNQSAHITALITNLPQEYFADGAKGAIPHPAAATNGSEGYPAAALAFE